MDTKSNTEKSIDTKETGKFTSREVKAFEENIVNQHDYLEKIKKPTSI